MISLYSMLWVCAAFFGVIGVIRGLRREVVALGGIILATFALFQFDNIIRGTLLATAGRTEAFFVQVGLFGVIVYFAYQTRSIGAFEEERSGARVSRLQDAILGGLLGAVNGYLIWGSVWYFLDINEYPLSPLVAAPTIDSVSAQSLNAIPLVLIGGATGSGEIFTIIVVLLFLAVLFVI
jgi:hypothetical protein